MMRTRVPRLSLEESLFDEQPNFISHDEVVVEVNNPRCQQSTCATGAMKGCDKCEGSRKVADFFALSSTQQAVELANALLRQFAFRRYSRRAPEVIPAFNNAFPRTLHSLTCKSLVRALLDELGLTDGAQARAEDAEAEQVNTSSTVSRDRRAAGAEQSTVSESEREDTLLELLVRHVLLQFHAQHPGRYQTANSGSFSATKSNAGGSRNNRTTTHFREVRRDKKNCDAGHNEFASTAHITTTPSDGKERDTTSALRKFFRDYPAEDEQVYVIANELLRQHVSTPYSIYMSTTPLVDVINERETSLTSDVLLPGSGGSCIPGFDASLHDSRKEDGGRLSQERHILIEFLKSVQEGTMSSAALSALFEKTILWSSSTSVRECPLDCTFSTANSLRSSLRSLEPTSRQNGVSLTTGNDTQEAQETLGKEKRRRLPSLLCLHLQSHLQEKPLSVEDVNRRMLRIERESAHTLNWSMSFREPLISTLFSPVTNSGTFSNGVSISQSKYSSPSSIVSVRSMEGMTRIGRGSSGELFAMRRIDTGELVAVKRIYVTELSRQHVENELSVLRRNIGIGTDSGHSNKGNTKPNISDLTRAHYTGSIIESEKKNEEENEKDEKGEKKQNDMEINDSRAVVRCYDAFFDSGCAFIVMELMDSGSLIDALNARGGRPFKEEECRAITFQVLHGLRYLHDTLRQLHRDLKPHNILLDRSTGAVKLTDFGLASKQLQSMGFNQCGTYVGTLAYMSPSRVDAASVYGKESDFWSLGITLLQLALGKLPFSPNVFVIAGFATHPPRLFPTHITSGNGNTSATSEKDDTHTNSSLITFSEDFQDFIAVLLPTASEKNYPTPIEFTVEEDSSSSCAFSFSGCQGGNVPPCAGDADEVCAHVGVGEEDEMEKAFADDAGFFGVLRMPMWPTSEGSHTPMKDGPVAARSRGMHTDMHAENGHGQQAEAGLTATALLQHPWLRGMTWAKSTAIVSAMSLEEEVEEK